MKKAQKKISLQENMQLNRTEKLHQKSLIREAAKQPFLLFKYSDISVPEINTQFILSLKNKKKPKKQQPNAVENSSFLFYFCLNCPIQ